MTGFLKRSQGYVLHMSSFNNMALVILLRNFYYQINFIIRRHLIFNELKEKTKIKLFINKLIAN